MGKLQTLKDLAEKDSITCYCGHSIGEHLSEGGCSPLPIRNDSMEVIKITKCNCLKFNPKVHEFHKVRVGGLKQLGKERIAYWKDQKKKWEEVNQPGARIKADICQGRINELIDFLGIKEAKP